jgi:hypothetical protein
MKREMTERKARKGLHFSATSNFPKIVDGTDPQMGPERYLYNGKNTIKHLVISYGGTFDQYISKLVSPHAEGGQNVPSASLNTARPPHKNATNARVERVIGHTLHQLRSVPSLQENKLSGRTKITVKLW